MAPGQELVLLGVPDVLVDAVVDVGKFDIIWATAGCPLTCTCEYLPHGALATMRRVVSTIADTVVVLRSVLGLAAGSTYEKAPAAACILLSTL